MDEQVIDIYKTQAYLDRLRKRFTLDARISVRNKALLDAFLRDAALGKTVLGKAKKKISPSRLILYVTHLRPFFLFTSKDADQVTQQDMEAFIEALEASKITSSKNSEQALSPRYQVDIKVTIRKFYKWLHGNNRAFPPLVEWIDTYHQDPEISALTEQEVERMIDRCRSVMHRALIQVLFDGGFRIGEILNVRLHHVELRSIDAVDQSRKVYFIRVPFSKTTRRTVALPMMATTKWLDLWLQDHPAMPMVKPDGTLEADEIAMQLFPISPGSLRGAVNRSGLKALNKRVYPHLLRHTSATYWSNKMPYFQFCKRFGWTMTSKMPQRYIDRQGVDETRMVGHYFDDERTTLMKENKRLLDELSELRKSVVQSTPVVYDAGREVTANKHRQKLLAK